jgi:hypothetical protein
MDFVYKSGDTLEGWHLFWFFLLCISLEAHISKLCYVDLQDKLFSPCVLILTDFLSLNFCCIIIHWHNIFFFLLCCIKDEILLPLHFL